MTEVRLFTPGPTPVPERVRKAGSQPMIHHRSPEFSAVLASIRKRLAELCGTSGQVAIFPSSGTGGLEAAAGSLFARGDEVVVVEAGKFGERWVELARHFGLKAKVVRAEWGRAATAKQVTHELSSSTRGVLIQACESSTGAFHPVVEIGRTLSKRDDTLLVVDAITAIGIHDLDMQRDGIDVMIGASQKALMSPPGLATVAVGPRALQRLETSKPQAYYFDLKREIAKQRDGEASFTPAISLCRSLNAALGMIEEEGKEAVFARHKKMSAMARAAFREDGLDLFNRDDEATYGITVANIPKGLDAKKWLSDLKTQEGLWLAGGQGSLSGKIFRLAHMGACTPADLLGAIETIEGSLAGHFPQAAKRAGYRKAKALS
ncbi:MAG TPA: alanine--glyoxylate aminotransferase family protein [Bdellovibrionota bacterium]|nr:alanine--glyoxylate aminotransferase family protein [Bdellovibrionota bacterium]